MDDNTRQYLIDRFEHYYSTHDIPTPTHARDREFGFIPWENDDQMVRHRSLTGMSSLPEYAATKHPRHFYMSAARFDAPSASTMEEKSRVSTTLVFDIDADHLPGVDPEDVSINDLLAAGKSELESLIDLLQTDFGFTDLEVYFSGGRGYHVHVHDDGADTLSKDARKQLVKYVTAEAVTVDTITETEVVSTEGAAGRKTDATASVLRDSGWGSRVRKAVISELESLAELSSEKRQQRFRELEQVGDGRAEALDRVASPDNSRIQEGVIDVHPSFPTFVDAVATDVFQQQAAFIDEPVTTDLNRLMRLPGSLHGGTGLAVTSVPISDLDSFDPLVDAVPGEFTGESVSVEVIDPISFSMVGENWSFAAGETRSVPRPVAIFLMAHGEAEYAD